VGGRTGGHRASGSAVVTRIPRGDKGHGPVEVSLSEGEENGFVGRAKAIAIRRAERGVMQVSRHGEEERGAGFDLRVNPVISSGVGAGGEGKTKGRRLFLPGQRREAAGPLFVALGSHPDPVRGAGGGFETHCAKV
jgi:hypothetical protein